MNIQEIKLTKPFAVIFSDAHCNINNIKKLQELYPGELLLSLGDSTFLFYKSGEKHNNNIIDFFIESKIPNLLGNHDSYLIAAERGNSFVLDRVMGSINDYNLTIQQLNYLESLPIGFKLILPNGQNYYCFHNEPRNLWNFPDRISEEYLRKNYIFDDHTKGICQGHLHKNQIDVFKGTPIKRYVIGQLCNSDHHSGNNNGKNYAILTEAGIKFKKLS